VPAKGEAANILEILPYLSGFFEVIVVVSEDDHESADAARAALPSAKVLYQMEQWLGPLPLINSLASILASVAQAASRLGVTVQLDPTFQPHFALYDGLVLKLVCQGSEAPVELASGGRYDALVGRFCGDSTLAAGMGFGFNVEAIRELMDTAIEPSSEPGPLLVAYSHRSHLAKALDSLEDLHQQGLVAEFLSDPVASQGDAESIAHLRGCAGVHWVGA
jgi:ATP phosphoribosyltransferase regulatory subunit